MHVKESPRIPEQKERLMARKAGQPAAMWKTASSVRPKQSDSTRLSRLYAVCVEKAVNASVAEMDAQQGQNSSGRQIQGEAMRVALHERRDPRLSLLKRTHADVIMREGRVVRQQQRAVPEARPVHLLRLRVCNSRQRARMYCSCVRV